MGLAANQARLMVLTSRRNDLEYGLTMLMTRVQSLTTQISEVSSEKMNAMKQFNENNKEADASISFTNSDEYAMFQAQIDDLEAAQSRLDLEQQTIETQLQAVESEEESVQKTVDNNIKNGFKYFN